MFLSVDGTALVQLINFGIFFGILSVTFLRPVSRAIRERREYIDSVQRDYERYQHQVRSLRLEADAARTAARRDAEETVVRARLEAEGMAADEAARYAAEAEMIAAEARATVEAELAAARTRTPALAHSLASSLLQQALGETAA